MPSQCTSKHTKLKERREYDAIIRIVIVVITRHYLKVNCRPMRTQFDYTTFKAAHSTGDIRNNHSHLVALYDDVALVTFLPLLSWCK